MIDSLFSLKGLAYFIGLLAIYILTKFIIIPYKTLLFYKRQGIPLDFVPFTGNFVRNYKHAQTHGDCLFSHKELVKNNPKLKALGVNVANYPMLILVHPTIIKEFYSNNDKYIKAPLTMETFKLLLGEGLATSEGETWKKHRRLISTLFHFEFLKSKTVLVLATTTEFLDQLERGNLTEVDLMNEFQKITGEVVGKIFFGRQLNKYQSDGLPLGEVLARLISDIGSSLANPVNVILGAKLANKTPAMKRIIARVKRFRGVCNQIIQERRELKKTSQTKNEIPREKDLLDLFLDLQLSGSQDSIQDEEIIDEFVSFFAAGMDTTGHLVTMMVYNVCMNPQFTATIRKEINEFYKGKDNNLTTDDLNSMEFLGLFIKETLRYNSPVNGVFNRMCISDHYLGDLKVKKGTLVALSYTWNNYNPEYFDEVEKFDPYRWSDGRTKNLHPFAYTPFSAGPRNCIGQHLSLIEAKVMMSEFLLRYDFKISEGYEHKMTSRFLYEPLNPFKVDLIKRSI